MKEALLDYIDHKLNQEDMGRVFPITFQGKEYFVKRDISNYRSSWVKPSARWNGLCARACRKRQGANGWAG